MFQGNHGGERLREERREVYSQNDKIINTRPPPTHTHPHTHTLNEPVNSSSRLMRAASMSEYRWLPSLTAASSSLACAARRASMRASRSASEDLDCASVGAEEGGGEECVSVGVRRAAGRERGEQGERRGGGMKRKLRAKCDERYRDAKRVKGNRIILH
jgi:hypothetical protein